MEYIDGLKSNIAYRVYRRFKIKISHIEYIDGLKSKYRI